MRNSRYLVYRKDAYAYQQHYPVTVALVILLVSSCTKAMRVRAKGLNKAPLINTANFEELNTS